MTSFCLANVMKPPMLSNEAIILIVRLIRFKGDASLEHFFPEGKCFFFTNAKMIVEFWKDTMIVGKQQRHM